jgi:hypothetical protein
MRMRSNRRAMLEAALRYADLGYPVFPCLGDAKEPKTGHGFLDASIDPEEIERWWSDAPYANLAIATAGLAVIDIDGNDNTWLSSEPDKLLQLAAAPTALTPHDGRHHVFRQPAGRAWRCTNGRLAPKVDTRADGGYLLVAPSRVGRGRYRWLEGQELDVSADRLPEPPDWLVADLDRLGDGTAEDWAIAGNVIPLHHRNTTLARLAGSMRRVGLGRDEIAAALLKVNAGRCVPPLADGEVLGIAASVARYEPDQITVAFVEAHWPQLCAEATEQAESEPPTRTVSDPGPIPDELLSVPGFVDEVVAHTLATAPYPQRALAFGSALALQAFLAGRKLRDEADNRTNLYVVTLANSGAGKDHPRKVNQRVLLEAGLAEALGDTFASGEGIEDRMLAHPAVLFQTDEIDGLMTRIHLGRDPRYEGIMNVLLKMYSSGNALYPMRVKADQPPAAIDQPCLCLFGTAIPKHYYEALSQKMLTNGFFARLFILEAGRRGHGQEAALRAVPGTLVEAARWWAEYRPGTQPGNLCAWHPEPRVVPATPEAAAIQAAFRRRADDEYSAAEDRGDETGMAVWARAHEKARRLAVVYSASVNRAAPNITPDAARWAGAFVEHQTRRMLFMAGEHVCENDFQARCQAVVATLRRWRDRHGDAWMPYWRLSRKHPWPEREHEAVRAALVGQRRVDYAVAATGGRPTKQYRLLGS